MLLARESHASLVLIAREFRANLIKSDVQYRCWRPPSCPKPPRSQTGSRTWTVAYFWSSHVHRLIDRFFHRIESMRRYVGTATSRIFERWSPDSKQIPSRSRPEIAELWPKPSPVHALLQVALRGVKAWYVVPLWMKPKCFQNGLHYHRRHVMYTFLKQFSSIFEISKISTKNEKSIFIFKNFKIFKMIF